MSENQYMPGYVDLHRSGILLQRGRVLWELLKDCRLCPRECGVDRSSGELGFCKASATLQVASHSPHFGEEQPLVGRGGSGTIFLSHCNLGCVFCQNWNISHQGSGRSVPIEGLAAMMLELQAAGCSNINIVTPTHYSPHVILALDLAAGKGLRLPLVWNTSGWERKEILELLDGVVDIYLADFKYTDSDMSSKYSPGADTYPEICREALLEMNRQVGTVRFLEDGRACRGLMIRHLVMPENVSGSMEAMRWIATRLPLNTYVNIMIQYRPAFRARLYPEIDRTVSMEEYLDVVQEARRCGLSMLDVDG